MDPSSDRVLKLLDLANDPTTPAAIKRQLPHIRRQAASSSKRALELLWDVARPVLDTLPRTVSQQTLYRAQTLAVVYNHCLRPDIRASVDEETFRRRVEQSGTPGDVIRQALNPAGIVCDAAHSWMVAGDAALTQASGRELKRLLKLGVQDPPFVLFVLPASQLTTAGVTVRPPTAADAAVGGHDYWRPNDIPAGPEFVDLDIPMVAVKDVLWRP